MEEFIIVGGVIESAEEFVSQTGMFEDEEDALAAARNLACEAYLKDPIRTIEEIMEEDEIDEEAAKLVFEDEMEDNIDYWVEPTEETIEEDEDVVPDDFDE